MGESAMPEIEKILDSGDEMKRMGAGRVLKFRNLEVPEREISTPEETVEEKEEETAEEEEDVVEEEEEDNLEQKTVKELKEMLRDKKMKVSGKKADLIERLGKY